MSAPVVDDHAYEVVDAFTATPLSGNPVAVFLEADDLPGETMQRLARETNLSETTFVLAPRGDGDHRVRIFTPVNELPFAGHPLLGTAVALAGRTGADRLLLETERAAVPFVLRPPSDAGGAGYAEMAQPVPTWEPYEHRDLVLEALDLAEPVTPVEVYRNGPRHVLVGMSEAELTALDPDHRLLARLPDVAVNCFARRGRRWRNRMFSPAYGVVEDAATGSAAGPLAVHLARHGLAPYGTQVEIEQGAQIGRPSFMYARAQADAEDRVVAVTVGGWGVRVARGTFRLPAAAAGGAPPCGG